MTERQKEILQIIVEDYIKTAKPVGSKSICEGLKLSSASVRSEMARLEDYGFLEKTHTSSGRVPSESGYRYYVDNLMKPKDMTGEDMLKLQTIFKNNSLVLSDVIQKSIEIISEITDYTALSLGKKVLDNCLKQVEVVPISDDTLVAIIITDTGYVENKNIVIKEKILLSEVKKVVDVINKLLVGIPISEIIENLEFKVKPVISEYVEKHETIYQAFYKVFNEFTGKNNMHQAGRINMLNQPEYNTVDKVKELFGKFDDESVIDSIEEDSSGIKIYIGKESKFNEDTAVIKTHYKLGEEEGTIAIVGPKRMDYERVVSILEYIKQHIERE
ncbi:MAG TPA: heat-inducible transcriptional repressor HrcA [Bacilli bacterium]|nr:heat-inducible transcriptional repressor HrcA [Bacilli bacterium]